MDEIERICSPTIEQYAEAAEVNYERTPYQRELDSPGRFEAFQKLGVELAVVRRAGRMEAVAYLLPAACESPAGRTSWAFMFQVAARFNIAGAGALLVRRVMQWYPAILGIGITPDAERLYKAFKWTYFPDVWRAVHPLNLDRMMDDYGARVSEPWRRKLLQSGAGIYNGSGRWIESLLSSGIECEPWRPPEKDRKASAVSSYLAAYRAGEVTAINVGGIGRICNRPAAGLGSLRQHAAIWREMRRDGVKACEMLIPAPQFRATAMRLGYYPLRLPVWYWDKQGRMQPVVDRLRGGEMSFLDTDKII